MFRSTVAIDPCYPWPEGRVQLMRRTTVDTRLDVGFAPPVMSLVEILAQEQSTSASALIRTAVIAMLNSFDMGGVRASKRVEASSHRMSLVHGEAKSGDFDPLRGVVVNRSAKPLYTKRIQINVDGPTFERLALFCEVNKISKARAIRKAVDRYLFDEVTKTGLSMWRGWDESDATD